MDQQQQLAQSKLQPIYAALDSRNYTRAVKLCSASAVSKHAIVKALKSHALERLGRQDEAKELLVQLLGFQVDEDCTSQAEAGADEMLDKFERPLFSPQSTASASSSSSSGVLTDDTTLTTIAVTLRALRLHRATAQMYEQAASASEAALKQANQNAKQHPQWRRVAAAEAEGYSRALRHAFFAHLRLALATPHYSSKQEFESEDDGEGKFFRLHPQWMDLNVNDTHLMNQIGTSTTTATSSSQSPTYVNDQQPKPTWRFPSPHIHYEAMQKASMQLAKLPSITPSTLSSIPGRQRLYWNWAVFSLLLHRHSLHATLAQNENKQDGDVNVDVPTKMMHQKMALLPKLAENLCQTKLLQVSKGERDPSGEEWKIYLRTLLVQHKYDEAIQVLQKQVTTTTAAAENNDKTKTIQQRIHDENDVKATVGSMLQMTHRERDQLLADVYLASQHHFEEATKQHQGLLVQQQTPPPSSDNNQDGKEPPCLYQWSSLLRMLGTAWYGALENEKKQPQEAEDEDCGVSPACRKVLQSCHDYVHNELLQQPQLLQKEDLDVPPLTEEGASPGPSPTIEDSSNNNDNIASPKLPHPPNSQEKRLLLQHRGPRLLLVELEAVPVRAALSTLSASSLVVLGYYRVLQERTAKLRTAIIQYAMLYGRFAPCTFRDVSPYLNLWVKAVVCLSRTYVKEQEEKQQHQHQTERRLKAIKEVREWMEALHPWKMQCFHGSEETETETKDAKSHHNKLWWLRGYIVACQMLSEVEFCLTGAGHNESEELFRKDVQECMDSFLPSVTEMVSRWIISLKTSSSASPGMRQKEGLPGDDLILLACTTLARQALSIASVCSTVSQTSDQPPLNDEDTTQQLTKTNATSLPAATITILLHATALLQHAIHLSPYAASLKLLLLQLYHHLNTAKLSRDLFATLGVKQVQVESLTYLTLQTCLSGGFYTEASRLCMDLLKLHRVTAGDIPQYVGDSLENGNVGVAWDMIQFQCQRMHGSLQLWGAKGMIMNVAPLAGVELQQQQQQRGKGNHSSQNQNKQSKKELGMVGSMNGLVGGEKDVTRAHQLIQDAADPFSAPSVMKLAADYVTAQLPSDKLGHSSSLQDENAVRLPSTQAMASLFMDNRDVSVCERLTVDSVSSVVDDIPSCSPVTFPSHVAPCVTPFLQTKQDIMAEACMTGLVHGILVKAALVMEQYLNYKKPAPTAAGGGRQQNKQRSGNAATDKGKNVDEAPSLDRRSSALMATVQHAHLVWKQESSGTHQQHCVRDKVKQELSWQFWKVMKGLCSIICVICDLKCGAPGQNSSGFQGDTATKIFSAEVEELSSMRTSLSHLRTTLYAHSCSFGTASALPVSTGDAETTKNQVTMIPPTALALVSQLVPQLILPTVCLLRYLGAMVAAGGSMGGKKRRKKKVQQQAQSQSESQKDSSEVLKEVGTGVGEVAAGLVEVLEELMEWIRVSPAEDSEINTNSAGRTSSARIPDEKYKACRISKEELATLREFAFPSAKESTTSFSGTDLIKGAVTKMSVAHQLSVGRLIPLLQDLKEVLQWHKQGDG